MSPFVDSLLQNSITRRLANPLWNRHVNDHHNFLLNNSIVTEVPPHIFATYRKRPMRCLEVMRVPREHIATIISINRISMVDGLSEANRILYIPDTGALERLDESF